MSLVCLADGLSVQVFVEQKHALHFPRNEGFEPGTSRVTVNVASCPRGLKTILKT